MQIARSMYSSEQLRHQESEEQFPPSYGVVARTSEPSPGAALVAPGTLALTGEGSTSAVSKRLTCTVDRAAPSHAGGTQPLHALRRRHRRLRERHGVHQTSASRRPVAGSARRHGGHFGLS
jgi:hypothetical protein